MGGLLPLAGYGPGKWGLGFRANASVRASSNAAAEIGMPVQLGSSSRARQSSPYHANHDVQLWSRENGWSVACGVTRSTPGWRHALTQHLQRTGYGWDEPPLTALARRTVAQVYLGAVDADDAAAIIDGLIRRLRAASAELTPFGAFPAATDAALRFLNLS